MARRQPPETLDDRLFVVQRMAARHGYDASPARLETLFADGTFVFTPTGVWTRRPTTPELGRLAELLTRAGVTSLTEKPPQG